MPRLIPGFPAFLDEIRAQPIAHERTTPAMLRRNHYDLYKELPSGKPDLLCVDILHLDGGVERCTTAIYGEHAYVIHYEFTKRLAEKE
jgi:hypothetical protein